MKHMSVLLISFFTFNASAAIPADSGLTQLQPLVSQQQRQALGLNGIYKFTKKNEVRPESVILNGEEEGNISGNTIEVYKDEAVAIEFLGNDKVLMTLRLPDEEVGNVPEQLILSMEEFNFLNLKMVSMGDVADLKANYTGYEDTAVAARLGRSARPRNHRVRQESSRRKASFRRDQNGRIAGGGGNCVSVVKSLTGFSGVAGNGIGMASALQRRGWRKVSYNSRRRGTVCSWSGGWGGRGHVGWFDGSCFVPTYGGNCGSPGKGYHIKNCVTRG